MIILYNCLRGRFPRVHSRHMSDKSLHRSPDVCFFGRKRLKAERFFLTNSSLLLEQELT